MSLVIFYFFSHTWNSKKYIIYLKIFSRGKRQSMIIIFATLIFRQYNNLGKGIRFNPGFIKGTIVAVVIATTVD